MPIYRQIHSPHVQFQTGVSGDGRLREDFSLSTPSNTLGWTSGVVTPFSASDVVYNNSIIFGVGGWGFPSDPSGTANPALPAIPNWGLDHGPKVIAMAGVVKLDSVLGPPSLGSSRNIMDITIQPPANDVNFYATEPQWQYEPKITLNVINTSLEGEQFLQLSATTKDKYSAKYDAGGSLITADYSKTIDGVRCCPYDKWFYICLFCAMMPDGSFKYRVDVNNKKVMEGLFPADEWSFRPQNLKEYYFNFATFGYLNAGGQKWASCYVAADAGEQNELDETPPPDDDDNDWAPGSTGRSYDPDDYMFPAHRVVRCDIQDFALDNPLVGTIQISQLTPAYKFSYDIENLVGTAVRVVVPKFYADTNDGNYFLLNDDPIRVELDGPGDPLVMRGVASSRSGSNEFAPFLMIGPHTGGLDLNPLGGQKFTNTSPLSLHGLFSVEDLENTTCALRLLNHLESSRVVDVMYGTLLVADPVSPGIFDDIFASCPVPTGVPLFFSQDVEFPDASLSGPEQAERLARFDITAIMNRNALRIQDVLTRCVDNVSGEQSLATVIDMNRHSISGMTTAVSSTNAIVE